MSAHLEYQAKDSSWRWLEYIAINLLRDATVQGVVVNYRHITCDACDAHYPHTWHSTPCMRHPVGFLPKADCEPLIAVAKGLLR